MEKLKNEAKKKEDDKGIANKKIAFIEKANISLQDQLKTEKISIKSLNSTHHLEIVRITEKINKENQRNIQNMVQIQKLTQ